MSRPDGPRPWPVVGHVPAYLRDKLGFLRAAAREHGPIVRLRLGGETWLLNELDAIHHVLVGNPTNYSKSPRMLEPRARRWAGDGLLTMGGDRHLHRRRMLQPAFHHHAVARFGEALIETIDEWIESQRDGEIVDVAAEMTRLTHRATGRVLLGADYAGVDAELGRAVVARRRYIGHLFLSPLPRPERWPLPVVLRYRSAMEVIDREVYGRISARRADSDPPDDLMSALLRAESRDGERLTDREIRDEIVTLMVTGWETVGEALSWAWYLLGAHPGEAARLHAEVDQVLDGNEPTVTALDELVRVACARDEALRLYPPTWIYVRMALGPDALPGGAAVEEGTKLYLCPWVTHRDPRFFRSPDSFDPDRFAGAARGEERPPAAFFPFGKGPHVCIGEPLARIEIALALARIAQRLELELLPGQRVVPDPGITLSPRAAVRMRVRIR